MFVGDPSIPGHIGLDDCRTTLGYAVFYHNPGLALNIVEVPGVTFKGPTDGSCFSKGSQHKPAVSTGL